MRLGESKGISRSVRPAIGSLPLGLADFSKRGFRLDRPDARQFLERHARSFLHGFNIVAGQVDPHSVLATVADEERGFAYEGAAMRAGLVDLFTAGRRRALATLLAGPGQRYVHLIHVGHGWGLVPTRVPAPVLVPPTPLLRWLALDGAGFAETFFGGHRALRARCRRFPTPRWEARVAGCGRALWFLEAGNVPTIGQVIESVTPAARAHLWAGVGLAACYAGRSEGVSAVEELVLAARPAGAYLLQGALFAIAARVRAGIVPVHTELACRDLFAVGCEEASSWTDRAADGLGESMEPAAFLEWKARLRAKAAQYL
ncbi:DUF1702 family protein [Amycolatopsis sp. NPDC005003]